MGQNLWAPSSPSPTPEALPSVKQILDRYVQAIGGAEALTKITSRTAKGSRIGADGVLVPEEVYQKAPDKLLTVTSYPNVVFSNGYNGTVGLGTQQSRRRDAVARSAPGPTEARCSLLQRTQNPGALFEPHDVLGKASVRDMDAYVIQATPV